MDGEDDTPQRRSVKYSDLKAAVQAHKDALGYTPEQWEAIYAGCRNSGEHRTPEKRELLRRIDERCRAAGHEPLPANY